MNITIYSTSTCGICHALMQWLDGKKIAYTKVIVDEDPSGMNDLFAVSSGAISVPYTVVKKDDGSEEKIAGFNQKQFTQVLSLS
jgi:mycoredoxin